VRAGTLARRVYATAAVGVMVGVGSALLLAYDRTIGLLTTPTLISCWILTTLPALYLVVRHVRWRLRRAFETDQNRRLLIPADVPAPSAFPGVVTIVAAQRDAHALVPNYQGAMYARGVTVAAMPSVAVLIAALQATTAPDNQLASGLAIANIAIMTALVVLVWRTRNPSQPWVRARTRAELLRREQFLCLAQVGPYQNLTSDRLPAVAAARATVIATAADQTIEQILPLQNQESGTHWYEQLYTHPHTELADLHGRACSYLHYRIAKQHLWFTLAARDNYRAERHTAATTRAALIAAVGATILQTALQFTPNAETITTLSATTGTLTLVLPPLCAFLLATQELFSYRRLADAYRLMIQQLDDARAALGRLVVAAGRATEADRAVRVRQFQTTVLQTEQLLTQEIQQWRLLIHRDEYDLSL
jgi:hypothetical protein